MWIYWQHYIRNICTIVKNLIVTVISIVIFTSRPIKFGIIAMYTVVEKIAIFLNISTNWQGCWNDYNSSSFLWCGALSSCHGVTKIVAKTGFIQCIGTKSCSSVSNMSSNTWFTCTSESSCRKSQITSTKNLHCSGFSSCREANISGTNNLKK